MSLPGLGLPTLLFAPPAGAGDHQLRGNESRDDEILTVDLDHLITSRVLIQGSSGAGKGWLIRTLLEQTHGRVQQIVLDKEGEFATLREKYDYILAGTEGDVPATPRTARVLCRHLMDLGASAVLDLYDLSLPDRQRFVRLFLEELMSLPKASWRPLLVVIDEAHFFAPEGGTTEASAAVISLCAEGRKRGFCAVIATQRLSKLSKDVAAELRNKLIGLTSLDVDVRRAADDLGFSREQSARLKELEPGQFFAVGPAIAKKVVLVRTGPVQTTHPRAGQIAAYAPPPPAEAVQAMLAQFAGLAEEAEAEQQAEREKADRVEALERQVEDLRGKLAEAQLGRLAAAPGEPAPPRIVEVERVVEKTVFVSVLTDEHVFALSERADNLRDIVRDTAAVTQELTAAADGIVSELRRVGETKTVSEANWGREKRVTQNPLSQSALDDLLDPDAGDVPEGPSDDERPPDDKEAPDDTALTRPQRLILDVLAGLAMIGVAQPTREQIALFAGVSHASSSFRNNLGALRTAGLADYPDTGLVCLTDAGRRGAAPAPRPPSPRLVCEAWLSRVSGPQRRILEVLMKARPRPLTREALAQIVGVSATSSSFRNNLGRLRSLGLLDYPSQGRVALTDLMFPDDLDWLPEGDPGA